MNLKQAKELVRGRLSDKRYEHTLNVRKMAVKLAKRYGVDEDKAALAALLHDSAKEISKDEMRAIMRAHPELAEGGEERPTPVWHGICAAILARTEWGVEDEAVLSAIACHTAGKPGMSRLDKIVYLADMTSAERDWPGVNKLRRLELKDLDLAMLAASGRRTTLCSRRESPWTLCPRRPTMRSKQRWMPGLQRPGEPVFLHTPCSGKEYRLQIVGKNVILWNMTTVSVGIKKLEEPNE